MITGLFGTSLHIFVVSHVSRAFRKRIVWLCFKTSHPPMAMSHEDDPSMPYKLKVSVAGEFKIGAGT